jgi:hypothetical protein
MGSDKRKSDDVFTGLMKGIGVVALVILAFPALCVVGFGLASLGEAGPVPIILVLAVSGWLLYLFGSNSRQ